MPDQLERSADALRQLFGVTGQQARDFGAHDAAAQQGNAKWAAGRPR